MPIRVYTHSFVLGLRLFDLKVSSSLYIYHDYRALGVQGLGFIDLSSELDTVSVWYTMSIRQIFK